MKKGMSLIVVLMMMLLATVCATSLYKVLTHDNFISGAQMDHDKSWVIAEGGIHESMALITYNASFVESLYNAFDSLRTIDSNYRFVPTKIIDSSNYKVFINDIWYIKNPLNIGIVLRSNSTTQQGAVSRIETGFRIYDLSLKNDSSITIIPYKANFPINDGLFISGSIGNLNAPITVNGSTYLNASFGGNQKLTVTGDFILGPNASASHFDQGLSVGGNMYSLSPFFSNGSDMNITGSLFLDSLAQIKYSNGNINIGKDLYALALIGSQNWLGKNLTVGGNASIFRGLQVDGTCVVTINKDAGFSGAIVDVRNGGKIFAKRNSNVYAGLRLNTGTGTFGTDATNWAHINSAPNTQPVAVSATYLQKNIAPNIWVGDTTLIQADNLLYIKSTLDSNAKMKKDPISIDTSVYNKAKRSWTVLLNRYSCGTGGFTATKANCIYTKTPTDSLLNGFVVLSLSGIDFNSAPGGTLSGKFVFTDINQNVNGNFPSTPSGSMSVIILTSNVNFGISGGADCYCLLYTKINTTMMSGNIHGSTIFASGSTLNINNSMNFYYDTTVLNGISSTGLFFGESNQKLSSKSDTIKSGFGVSKLSTLAPRVHLDFIWQRPF